MLDTWFHVNYGNEIRSDRQKRRVRNKNKITILTFAYAGRVLLQTHMTTE